MLCKRPDIVKNIAIIALLIIPLGFSCSTFEPERIFKVETNSVSEGINTSWSAQGTIIDLGAYGISQHGFCYATTLNPTVERNEGIVRLGSINATGGFSTSITDLKSETGYYIRAFITNRDSSTYGKALAFNTAAELYTNSLTVVTSPATSVQQSSAIIGGIVSTQGETIVIERGVYYSTSEDPQTSGIKVAIGSGTGSFSKELTGLASNTEYFYLAYAINTEETYFGVILSFTTGQPIEKPTVTTSAATSVQDTSATVGGNVISQGGAPVIERGIYYGTSPDPETTGVKVSIGSGLGEFATPLTGLIEGTKYYFVAFATNSAGTTYGTILSFNTSESIVKPSVTTLSATSVTENEAIVGGEVVDNGGGIVTERGIYYGTSSDPQTTGVMIPIGTGVGPFSTTLTSLIDGTKYYFVAFASNSAGTTFGTTHSFTTLKTVLKPSVTTVSATLVRETEAMVGGEVIADGGGIVTERGIYYSTSSDPLTTGINVHIGSGIGPFSTKLTGLIDGTRYYYVAFATNSAGTTFGTTLSFTTVERITVKDIDNNVYQTVMIGNQRWMAENLKTKRYTDGSSIQLVESNSAWETLSHTYKAYCYYDNNVSNGDSYGVLYTWSAAMNGAGSTNANPSGIQGVCPAGWHLPSDREWKEMEMSLGMSSSEADAMSLRGTTEGGELKQEGTSYWSFPNAGATNESGFTALPGGSRFSDAKFTGLYHDTSFWTATESDNTNALERGLGYDHSKVGRAAYYKGDGFAVRCIQD